MSVKFHFIVEIAQTKRCKHTLSKLTAFFDPFRSKMLKSIFRTQATVFNLGVDYQICPCQVDLVRIWILNIQT